jgi:hypothetical protein
MRRLVASLAAMAVLYATMAALLSAPMVAAPASALSVTEDGLVNVYVNDVAVAKGVNAAFAAAAVASLCELGDPGVAALASQVDQTDRPQPLTCPATGGPIWIVQN